jgi:hypothetical protein
MRTRLNNGREYELEAQYGLPEKLPAGEQILWQGSPDFWRTAKDIFYIRPIIGYFVFVVLYQIIDGFLLDNTLRSIFISAIWMIALSVVCIGMVASLAYLTSSTTVYTITNHRVVMRIGIALTKTFNVPFKQIVSADFTESKDSFGHIPLRINENTKIAYFHLWPHARPARFSHPEPMLRNIPKVKEVAKILTTAWCEENQVYAHQVSVKNLAKNTEHSSQVLSSSLTNDLGLT